jgi:para-aminobenzoate synthetase/4-amino-4-deoxychorismate lyase
MRRDGTIEVSDAGGLEDPFIPGPNDPGFTSNTVRLAIGAMPIDTRDPMLFHKTTWRDRYDAALAAAPADVDDVVLINTSHQVVETTIANIAALIDGHWLTPPLQSGCLPGVMRAHLLRTGELTEVPIELSDLQRAEALAVINSVRGWRRGVVTEWG